MAPTPGNATALASVIKGIKSVLGLRPRRAACIDATRDELRTIARDYWNNGIRHIVACAAILPPGGGSRKCTPPITRLGLLKKVAISVFR